MNFGELHVISTGRQSTEQFVDIAVAIHPFITAFHIRERTKSASELYEMIEHMCLSGIAPSKIIVNDRIDVAVAAAIRGAHLAHHSLPITAVKRSFPQLRIGKSVHSISEAKGAARSGADYLMYGHLYPTESKHHIPARGITSLRDVVKSVAVPVIAIGGIKQEHVSEVMLAGATGIAVMSGILEAADPLQAAQHYYKALQNVDSEDHY